MLAPPLLGVVLRVEEIVAAAQGGPYYLLVAGHSQSHVQRNLWLAVDRLCGQCLTNRQGCVISNLNAAEGGKRVAGCGLGAKDEVCGAVIDPLNLVDWAIVRLDVSLYVVCVQGVDALDVDFIGYEGFGLVVFVFGIVVCYFAVFLGLVWLLKDNGY